MEKFNKSLAVGNLSLIKDRGVKAFSVFVIHVNQREKDLLLKLLVLKDGRFTTE